MCHPLDAVAPNRTWGKSPGELPDWKRVGPAKAAEMLGPAITQEADAGLHARGFAPRTTAAVPGWEPDSGVAVRVTRPCARALLRGPPSIEGRDDDPAPPADDPGHDRARLQPGDARQLPARDHGTRPLPPHEPGPPDAP